MGRRNAETRPRLDDGRCWEADDHSADVPLQHLPTKCPDKQRQHKTGATHNSDGLISAPQAPHINMLLSLMCRTEIINSSVRFWSYLENEKQQDKSSEPEPLCHPDSPDYPAQLSSMFKALKTSDYVKRRGITHPILAGI